MAHWIQLQLRSKISTLAVYIYIFSKSIEMGWILDCLTLKKETHESQYHSICCGVNKHQKNTKNYTFMLR